MEAPEDEELEQTSGREGAEIIGNNLAKPAQTEKPIRLHNKPRKAQDYVMAPEDYACTGDDWSVIENIMSEPSDKRNLVSIDGSHLQRKQLERLLIPGEFVGDEIVDAYIHCISAKEHLQMRSGGSVFLENACISKMIKEFSSIRDDAPRWVLDRATTYLEHDMIFIPVNIEDFHWYLAVINTRVRRIQILDSLGPGINRKDLTTMLEGLENIFQYASLQMELKSDKWEDVNITAWPREECIKSSLQTDGYTSFDSNLLLPSPFGTSFSFRISEPLIFKIYYCKNVILCRLRSYNNYI